MKGQQAQNKAKQAHGPIRILSDSVINQESYIRRGQQSLSFNCCRNHGMSRRQIRFHCVVCSSECDRRAIQCGNCGRWTHIDSVGFSEDVQDVYTRYSVYIIVVPFDQTHYKVP